MPNFFQLYADYVKDMEPPHNYQAWSAVGAISALLGKKCQIPQGHFTVFPNLYIVLVGEPAMRKSSAMNIAKRLVKLIEQVPVAAESGSREGLLDDMAANKVQAIVNGTDISYWQSAAFPTEFSDFLGGKHINESMVRFMTTIWDEAIYKEKTRKGGEVVINNPYFTLLGCCTPGWMTEKLKQDVITDGLARRTIFAYETELNCLNEWPDSTPEQLQMLVLLRNEASRIFHIGGRFELSQPARDYYGKKYRGTREEAKGYSEKVQNYFSSKHILALKLAMCLSAGVDSKRIISLEQMKAAFSFLAQSERALDIVFAGVGRNELKPFLDKGLNRIRAAGTKGLTKAEFTSALYSDMNAAEISEVWETLLQTEKVTAVMETAQGVPRCRAASLDPLPPALNLMKLASLLTEHQEPKMVATQAFSIASHLAPETSQLLALEKEWTTRTSTGVLLRGRKTQAADASQIASDLQASSPDPQTPKPAP